MKTSIIAALGAALVLAAASAPASAGYGHKSYGHGYGHKFHGFKNYSYGYGHCNFKKVKFFGDYGWSWKFVKHCY